MEDHAEDPKVYLRSLSARGAALTQIGVPLDKGISYAAELTVDPYLLVVQGYSRSVPR